MRAVLQQRENTVRLREGVTASAGWRRSNSPSERVIRRTTPANGDHSNAAASPRSSASRQWCGCGLTDVGSGAQHIAGAERHATCGSEPERGSCCKVETESMW